MEYFNYVIARKWSEDSNHLSCYCYGNTVFYGNLEDANEMLDFIRNRVGETPEEYGIYKINNIPIKPLK
jgi:hypothetical protein